MSQSIDLQKAAQISVTQSYLLSLRSDPSYPRLPKNPTRAQKRQYDEAVTKFISVESRVRGLLRALKKPETQENIEEVREAFQFADTRSSHKDKVLESEFAKEGKTPTEEDYRQRRENTVAKDFKTVVTGGAVEHYCGSCNKTTAVMLKCGRCKEVFYCDRNCQRAHWPTHKSVCVVKSSTEDSDGTKDTASTKPERKEVCD